MTSSQALCSLAKEREILGAVREESGEYETRADEIFKIVKDQREY